MLGLDTWGGSSSQVEGFRRNGGITFPMLLNASGSAPSSYDNLVVVGPDGTVKFSDGSISSSLSAAEAKVNELLAQIPPPVPAITVQEQSINFGTIDAGQTGQQTIAITNTGTVPLQITGIQSDVSGLTFEPSMFTLSPNGSQTVTVTFPSSTEGEFSGSISISSNDPNSATNTLSVSIIVQVPFANPKADFNGDKEVNITDFLLFVNAFGSTDSQYDIDGDGVVGLPDFLLFVQSFGKTVNG